MIRLVIEPYCQNCAAFEPTVETHDTGKTVDHFVLCLYRQKCETEERRVQLANTDNGEGTEGV